MSSGTDKKDYFGRNFKEKFPHYASGIIIPRCVPINSRAKPRRKGRLGLKGITVCSSGGKSENKCTDPGRSASPSTAADNCSSSEQHKSRVSKKPIANTGILCQKVADIVAEEVPCGKIDHEFLNELQFKCKRYWDLLVENSITLDEEAVFEELTCKLRQWVRENQSLLEQANQTSRSDAYPEEYSDQFEDDEEDEHDDEDEEYEYVVRFPLDGGK